MGKEDAKSSERDMEKKVLERRQRLTRTGRRLVVVKRRRLVLTRRVLLLRRKIVAGGRKMTSCAFAFVIVVIGSVVGKNPRKRTDSDSEHLDEVCIV